MNTKRHHSKRRKTRKRTGGKKWTTAIDAAQKTLDKTGSMSAARRSLRKQAMFNAKKLFGSVSTL